MHFEIFCGGSNKANIIEKVQAVANKDKQKSKTLIKEGTALYQHIPVPNKDISFTKGSETKTGGVYYSGANAIKQLATDGDYEQLQHVGEYRAKKVWKKRRSSPKRNQLKNTTLSQAQCKPFG